LGKSLPGPLQRTLGSSSRPGNTWVTTSKQSVKLEVQRES